MTDKPSDQILSLIAAMERAKANHSTDDDKAKRREIKDLGHQIINLVGDAVESNHVERGEALQTLAAILGIMIHNSTPPGLRRELALTILLKTIIDETMKKDD